MLVIPRCLIGLVLKCSAHTKILKHPSSLEKNGARFAYNISTLPHIFQSISRLLIIPNRKQAVCNVFGCLYF